MPSFAAIQRDRKPKRVVVLEPAAFADDWEKKPAGKVAIGLRLISQDDSDRGRREAEREATGFYNELREAPLKPDPNVAVDVYNDALVMHAVARCTCDPNDVTRPYFEMADDTVRRALTPEGARRIWDELTILRSETAPTASRASDEEVLDLSDALAQGGDMPDVARLLCARLAEVLGVREGESVYVAKSL